MSTLSSDDRRFEFLVDALTGYGVYMLDLEGRVASWNRGAEALKGYTADEIHGQPFSRFFTLEDRKAGLPERLLARATRDGRVESEGWRVRKDGSRFWAVAALQVMRDDSGAMVGFAKITRDMTEQREAQQALLESDRRFRHLVEGVVDYGIYMLDPNGVVTNWNRGAERIKGYRSDEIVGRHYGQFYTAPERNDGAPARNLARALKEGRFEGEGWRLRRDGSQFWASVVIDPIYDDDGRHIGFAKITRDISERRAAEVALTQSERQFRLLIDSVVDYAIYMLDPNGIVTNWNTGAQKIKGYAADEIIGHHFSRFYTPADRAAGAPLRGLNTATSEGRFETEGWRMRKDGSQFWANVVIDAIRDEQGQLIGFAKITRDITERKIAEAELQRAQDQIAQSQKMEALGQLTGGVAHDFNNLLMVVSGHTQLLRARVSTDPKIVRSLEAIEIAARRGEDLTRHLLSFARRQRLQTTVAPFAERMVGVRELVSSSLPPTVQLLIDMPAELWPVKVDQGELDLALLNLAVNARDAMPSGGVLSISAENLTLGEANGQPPRDVVAVTVSDTGVGIPPDILDRIFEPFFTTKEVNKGTGLGLSQVFGFAQQAGGDLKVFSQLAEGTRFVIHLPRSAETAGALEEASDRQVHVSDAEAIILVVEDNPDVAEVAASLLQQIGHEARVVGSAAAALAALQDGDPPDLVFSDVVMAGDMDGVALARTLREQHPDLPILLATGYSQAAERIGGEFPILSKPYKLHDLQRAIAVLLATSHGQDKKLVALDVARRARARNAED
ncbi:MAG: PAS domain S-box protein [Caulobacteraceae bacterium]|nr:PAS domain S-box protein [Caulobacteraceae bacterium]